MDMKEKQQTMINATFFRFDASIELLHRRQKSVIVDEAIFFSSQDYIDNPK